ncbi:hypothetical protein [Flavobacterium sp.]|uniref:hypothetical protein n=1 Tax=Flavobacterium sp. TaxID=239 RepID=UPI002FDCC06E
MKNNTNNTVVHNLKLLLNLVFLFAGLYLCMHENSVQHNGLLGTGILLSGYTLMNIAKKE